VPESDNKPRPVAVTLLVWSASLALAILVLSFVTVTALFARLGGK
jgi:hypothetical protein